ncbi:CubicO group peptidase (beta-lactamase class C family) [Chitinophaga dinghuensis]|uniref:CubicO group peptidase (Beta-lactamase class C family) n=1 Tax=Chitinophaga dinghuensis TaxID=1539050 RepID=A0A327VVQ7_9BACT|nr:serine hydrolase domain-containing protein [Chitinophaga dinghuensis]RAJ80081.1 CubicO group peptidase (beta-lactamase class C family) [Chitinophaga dinghuensis]
MKTFFLTLFVLVILVGVNAQSQNSDTQKSAAVDRLFANFDTARFSGISILVINNGRKVYNKSFGYADRENKVIATSQTNYRIASITKQFTAMAIMMLKDEGLLSLNDRLPKFFPSLSSLAKDITIRHLLTHTAGLPDYGDLVPSGTTTPLKSTDVLHLIESADSLRFQPGTRFSYSNTGYVFLELVIEKVSGMSFSDFVKSHLFAKVDMLNSTLNSTTGTIVNRAYGYNFKEGKLVKEDQSIYSYLLGDGGIYTSLDDFYKWDQAFYGEKLVKADILKEIFTKRAWETPSIAYGYGWYIDEKYGKLRLSHSGGTKGFSTNYVRFPNEKISIVVFANQDEGVVLDPIINAIERIYVFDNIITTN